MTRPSCGRRSVSLAVVVDEIPVRVVLEQHRRVTEQCMCKRFALGIARAFAGRIGERWHEEATPRIPRGVRLQLDEPGAVQAEDL